MVWAQEAPVAPQRAPAGQFDEVGPVSADGDDYSRLIPESGLATLNRYMRADLQRSERAGCYIVALPGGFSLIMSSRVAVVCGRTPATGEGGVVHRHRAADGMSVQDLCRRAAVCPWGVSQLQERHGELLHIQATGCAALLYEPLDTLHSRFGVPIGLWVVW